MSSTQQELIRRIASVVGHELRNPLAVIGNSSYFLKTKLAAAAQADPKVAKHLGIIASEIARADRLISDMLAFSRPLEPKLAPTGLSSVVELAIQAAAPADGVKLRRETPKSAITIRADAAILADALRRILDNAAEAMGGSGTATVAINGKDGAAFVEIRDTGPGLKPEILPSLFQPFFSTKPRGLGLGLAMAQKAAAAHGGKIEAKNLPQGGASFTLSVPKT